MGTLFYGIIRSNHIENRFVMKTFKDYNLGSDIQRALEVLKYENPTEVQEKVIDRLLNRENLIVKSQTGSGKTAAFVIPTVEHIDWEVREAQTLILTPTRELALQIQEDVFNIGRFKRIKVEAIFGRSSFEQQERKLKEMVHVIVATPGRLIDHVGRGTVNLSKIQTLIIDEADEMLAMGFIDQIEKVLKSLPKGVNIALFSATMPDAIRALGKRIMKVSTEVEIKNHSAIEDRILQEAYFTQGKQTMLDLKDIIIVENPDTSILFCNTKDRVEEVADMLWDMGIDVHTLHGGMEQRDRTRVITDFKRGKFRYLVATDVAARGLDIEDVQLVVNVDIPENSESYIHRIGRTARIDKEGKAISFVDSYTKKYLDVILEETNNQIEIMKRPSESFIASRKASFEAKIKRLPKLKKDKGHDFKDEILKIHINAGKKTKMRAVDIVGAICSIEGITKDDIGVISIVDVSTFVEILNNKGAIVLKALQTQNIKGRPRVVNRANLSEYEKALLNK